MTYYFCSWWVALMWTDVFHWPIRMRAMRSMLPAKSHLIVRHQTSIWEKNLQTHNNVERNKTLFLLRNIHIPLRRNVTLFHLKQTGSTPSRPEKLKLHFHWLAPKQVSREYERKETAKVCVWLTSLVILVILQGHGATSTSNTINSITITQHSCHIQGGGASWPTQLSLVEC